MAIRLCVERRVVFPEGIDEGLCARFGCELRGSCNPVCGWKCFVKVWIGRAGGRVFAYGDQED